VPRIHATDHTTGLAAAMARVDSAPGSR